MAADSAPEAKKELREIVEEIFSWRLATFRRKKQVF
jgi:hypothetical protein